MTLACTLTTLPCTLTTLACTLTSLACTLMTLACTLTTLACTLLDEKCVHLEAGYKYGNEPLSPKQGTWFPDQHVTTDFLNGFWSVDLVMKR